LLVASRTKRPVDAARLFAHHEGCRFLIEDRSIGLLPTAGLLALPAAERSPALERLVVADPRPLPAGVPALAWSRAEAQAVAGELGPSVRLLTGEAASESAVKALLPLARRVHFATHGVLDDERPGDSRLALAPLGDEDGWLRAHEVEEGVLAAERVVLSACETMGTAGRGEGLLGLARAFLAAGARSVVATSWAVDDETTSALVQRYEAALAGGAEPLAALRAAQVGLLRGSGRPGLSHVHPYFWAGFQHVGAR
jgi:CHAT domain-containing protein